MQLGRYRLESPAGAGPAGAAFHAVADDGTRWEARLLDRAKADPAAWAALARRLRLVGLVDHPAVVRPAAVDLGHDPPYLVMPDAGAATDLPADREAARLTAGLAAAHRVGLTLGRPGHLPFRQAAGGWFALDLTGTDPRPGPAEFGDSDPADDVARVAEFLAFMFPAAAEGADWRPTLAKMRAPAPADRPLADEAAGWFARPAVARPHAPAALDRTIDSLPEGVGETGGATPVEEVEPVGPGGLPGVGARVGRFLLREKIGEGGVGAVFRADDPADGAAVAVKVLRPAIAGSPAARRRFVKEARLLAALDSPYVTRLVDANTDGDRCYLALEFVPGQSLGAVVRGGARVDERTALGYVADAARGLAAAHAVGIVHRDIKPDNLLVAPAAGGAGPRVKVTDFGLARPVVQSESLELTRAGSVVGTPLYMAPEQFGGDPADPRADVYALGATLFHLLTGRPPFPHDSLTALARAIAADDPPAVDRLNPAVSAATAALVARCLSKDPAARPADAGAFARAVDRLLGGEPTDLAGHPKDPSGGPVYETVLEWELAAPPAAVWPLVSDTERVNRAAGLPAVTYTLSRAPGGGTRRLAAARVGGLNMEWEEHPFEWVEGRRMGVLREFTRGPFLWFVSVVDLLPRAGGGTTVRQTLRAAPRGLLGRVAARVELGLKAPRNLGRVYRRIDAALAQPARGPAADPFEGPTRLAGPRQRRVTAGVARLRAAGVSPDAAELLGIFLANAPDQEVGRVRPLALARRFGVDEAAVTDACLRAVGEGLLELRWDIICPLCRIPSGRRDTLREVREHETCQACDAPFRADFAAAVELVFKAHPDVRPADAGTYCAGGPAHSPHVVAQARVAAGERVEVDLALSEGPYRLRGPQLPWTLDLRVAAGAATRRWEVDLAGADRDPPPPLAAGGQVLVLRNGRPHELVVRVERAAARDDALTAARATALPAFRDLFPGELLSPGQLAPASAVTLLVAGVDGGDELFDRAGEARAFHLLQAAFRAIEGRVRAAGGTVVKTVGEAVVAAFPGAEAAVRAAVGLADAVAADPVAGGLRLRAGVHKGLALVATVNDRLDYFGRTAKVAARLQEEAAGGELVVSAAAADDPEVMALLAGRPVTLAEVPAGGRGAVLAYRTPLKPPAGDRP